MMNIPWSQGVINFIAKCLRPLFKVLSFLVPVVDLYSLDYWLSKKYGSLVAIERVAAE